LKWRILLRSWCFGSTGFQHGNKRGVDCIS
jgi:hypothetical protein